MTAGRTAIEIGAFILPHVIILANGRYERAEIRDFRNTVALSLRFRSQNAGSMN